MSSTAKARTSVAGSKQEVALISALERGLG